MSAHQGFRPHPALVTLGNWVTNQLGKESDSFDHPQRETFHRERGVRGYVCTRLRSGLSIVVSSIYVSVYAHCHPWILRRVKVVRR